MDYLSSSLLTDGAEGNFAVLLKLCVPSFIGQSNPAVLARVHRSSV